MTNVLIQAVLHGQEKHLFWCILGNVSFGQLPVKHSSDSNNVFAFVRIRHSRFVHLDTRSRPSQDCLRLPVLCRSSFLIWSLSLSVTHTYMVERKKALSASPETLGSCGCMQMNKYSVSAHFLSHTHTRCWIDSALTYARREVLSSRHAGADKCCGCVVTASGLSSFVPCF